ncbi:hypothetical protein BDK51DRAFT_51725 [Blyttiomyces helicus]|uniref:Uncharacterized protein n=1 Tax=Blyttiomyces helicus TaxID=388810 RepID=A0A4P9WFX6_9FUNG|nr:hypothetical protein BDK51DRAFT_51725 [Blyttiomyces helicus]|eukprot:RKO91701.1 hypothetical protein BDK51DRAFT_51725 [Blyttiomyces helicus]
MSRCLGSAFDSNHRRHWSSRHPRLASTHTAVQPQGPPHSTKDEVGGQEGEKGIQTSNSVTFLLPLAPVPPPTSHPSSRPPSLAHHAPGAPNSAFSAYRTEPQIPSLARRRGPVLASCRFLGERWDEGLDRGKQRHPPAVNQNPQEPGERMDHVVHGRESSGRTTVYRLFFLLGLFGRIPFSSDIDDSNQATRRSPGFFFLFSPMFAVAEQSRKRQRGLPGRSLFFNLRDGAKKTEEDWGSVGFDGGAVSGCFSGARKATLGNGATLGTHPALPTFKSKLPLVSPSPRGRSLTLETIPASASFIPLPT